MLNGCVDDVTRHVVRGWAQDLFAPEAPVKLAVAIDGTIAFRVIANRYRPDLEAAGLGDGRHSFEIKITGAAIPLHACILRIYREEDEADVPGSPVRLAAADEFDNLAKQAFAALLASPGTVADLQDRIAYLAGQTECLLQRVSDRQSRRVQHTAHRQHQGRWMPDARGSSDPSPRSPRALVIDDTMPAVQRDAGSNAILSHMASLQRLGYEVVFVAADMRGDAADLLHARGISTCCTPWLSSVEELLRRQSGEFDLVYMHRYSVAARYVALVRQYMQKARLVFSVADLHHIRLTRQADVENRPELAAHAKYVRSQELIAASSVHAVVTHSTFEAEILRRYLPGIGVHVVPWAVPIRPVTRPFQDRHGLALIGNYAHSPNFDAAVWLVQDIMPLVWRHDPTITCLLVGSNMPEALKALVQPGVEIVGAVANLDEVFGRIRLTVAPLAYGAGAKGKVWDSLAAGVPCVCTAVAAEGLNLPGSLHSLVAPDVPAFVDAILRLHGDEDLNRKGGQAALSYAASYLREQNVDSLMRNVTGQPAVQVPTRDERGDELKKAGMKQPSAVPSKSKRMGKMSKGSAIVQD
jgi:hypothetical protein